MLFHNNPIKYSLMVCLCALGALTTAEQSHAAELDLADSPLYLSTNAPPNILFIIDDSGSMDWEIMTKGGIFSGSQRDGSSPLASGGIQHRDGDGDGDLNCSFGAAGNQGVFSFGGYVYGVEFGSNSYSDDGDDCNTADDRAWRFRNHDFNSLYFNPELEYEPWAGVNDDGVPFADMPITEAMADPFDTNSETIDLTRHNSDWAGGTARRTSDWDGDGDGDGFRYYLWNDLDGDNLFDNGEETEFLIQDQDAATRQNFANWFSYHRSREFVAKSAYGHVIARATAVRMGLVTLHNHNNVNTAITEMNDDVASGNKLALMNQLYNIFSRAGTPLRTTLNECGRYLGCRANDVLSGSPCPALSEAEGGACQQNFSIVMTDGFYNGDSPGVGNADGDGDTNFDGGAYADGQSNTLADVAMEYYENDLHAHLPDEVAVLTGVDEARHQHVVTYTVAFGVNGTLTENPPNTEDAFLWPGTGGLGRIDDLRHAAYNGRGEFLSAQDPEELAESLKEAINSIADRTSAAAAVALNTSSLSSESLVYQARFESTGWSGELRYLPIDLDGVISAPTVEVSNLLDDRTADSRVIISYDPTTGSGIPFRWHDLNSAQKNALDEDADGNDDGDGEERLNYLRGERLLEESSGGPFRNRNGKLGDIIYSSPAYVGSPPHYYDFDSYDVYRENHADRIPMVYVGANDGMLHGFHAKGGTELLAYVPSMLIDQLSELTATDYVHRYYVDGSPTVGDAFFDGRWHTVLLGHLRGGGQGLFALDVTDPASMSEANAESLVLWEFTDQDDIDLGYTFSQPLLVKMANGQWAAVFGNGYNNSENDGRRSSNGEAVLYIVDVSNGDIIRKISTGVGSAQTPNGLATPTAVDIDNDAVVDYLYAGDLRGNLWRFNLNGSDSNDWHLANNGDPIYRAVSPEGEAQSIVVSPMVGFHPEDDPEDALMVYFGTGKFIEIGDNDVSSVATQSFYGIRDDLVTPRTVNRGELLQQSITAELIFPDTSTEVRITSDYEIDWNVHNGWLMDFTYDGDNRGEMQVTESILRDGRIIFTTLIPNDEMCSFGGSGWLMELDAANGGRLGWTVFDLNNDGFFTALDWIDNGSLPSGSGGSTGGGSTGGGTGGGSTGGGSTGGSNNNLGVEYDDKTSVSGTKSNSIPSQPRVTQSNNREYTILNDTSGDIINMNTNAGRQISGRLNWRQLR